MPFDAYYRNAKNYTVNTVLPSFIKDGNEKENYPYDSRKEMFENIKKLFKNEKEIVSKEIYYVETPWVKITYKDGSELHEKIEDPYILLKLKEDIQKNMYL